MSVVKVSVEFRWIPKLLLSQSACPCYTYEIKQFIGGGHILCLFMFEKFVLTKILPVGIKISRANLKRKQNREKDRKNERCILK